MEQRGERGKMDEQDATLHIATIAANAPEREMPGTRFDGEVSEELTVILHQIESYFDRQAGLHNLETLNFCLRHLFNRVDFLYRQALPGFGKATATTSASEEIGQQMVRNQQIWLQLQSVNRTLDRLTPLCHLLSDVIECLLDTLDNEELWLRPFQEEETLLLKQVHLSGNEQNQKTGDFSEQEALRRSEATTSLHDAERWDRAVNALMDQLLIWQDQHHKLVPFRQHFPSALLAKYNLNELEGAFSVLLDSAGAIFGDILPNFRLVEPEDREEISALLFDLMQQADQMLAQFEIVLEPLTGLLRHFAVVNENG